MIFALKMIEQTVRVIGVQNNPRIQSRAHDDRGLWRRWVAANSIGETVGLGGAALAGLLVASFSDDGSSLLWRVIAFAVMVLAGVFEGVAVGVAQWLGMRRALPEIKGSRWTLATALGAFIAWIMGMIPSFMMGNDNGMQGPGPSEEMVIILAAGMGILLGPVLGIPQWVVLRRHLPSAGWWILANSAAWGIGMPIIFIGIGMIADGNNPLGVNIAMGALTCAVAGAAVGAVHGVALKRLIAGRDRLVDHVAQ